MAAAVLAHVDDWFEREIYAPLRAAGAGEVPAAITAMFDTTAQYFRGGGRVCLVGAFALDDTRDRSAAVVQDSFRRGIASLATAPEQARVQQPAPRDEMRVAALTGASLVARPPHKP